MSAHQWVAALDNPLAAAVVCLSIFPAFLERINADFYHCFSSPPKERGREYIGRRIRDNDVIPQCLNAVSLFGRRTIKKGKDGSRVGGWMLPPRLLKQN